jgi:hypothetical protein
MTFFNLNAMLNTHGFLAKKSARARSLIRGKSAIKAHWSVSLSHP